MTRDQKSALAAAIVAIAAIAIGVVRTLPQHAVPPVSIIGVVLAKDSDPRKQTPIPNAIITGTSGASRDETKSDSAGFFRLTLAPSRRPPSTPSLRVTAAGYQPLEITAGVPSKIIVAYVAPVFRSVVSKLGTPDITLSDVRLRYSAEATTITNIGSVAKTFEVLNTNGIPCGGHTPCSPDGKWKAAIGSASFDAGSGNEFRKPRASCIAGPCPFTKIESEALSQNNRIITISARNWSDTATFLVEAEVIQNRPSSTVRESYPVIFGDAMSFTLPAASEGPSVQADINGAPIVFPLGPDLILSWANCTMKRQPDGSKLFRCELKPGYRFQ